MQTNYQNFTFSVIFDNDIFRLTLLNLTNKAEGHASDEIKGLQLN